MLNVHPEAFALMILVIVGLMVGEVKLVMFYDVQVWEVIAAGMETVFLHCNSVIVKRAGKEEGARYPTVLVVVTALVKVYVMVQIMILQFVYLATIPILVEDVRDDALTEV